MRNLIALMLAITGTAFAEGEVALSTAQNNPAQPFLMFGIAALFFYTILWRPEQKRRKELEQTRNSIKQGDKIQAMGLVGIIERISDSTVIIRTAESTLIEILKDSIAKVEAVEGAKVEVLDA
jgi:preprotein translocase subunit YajC